MSNAMRAMRCQDYPFDLSQEKLCRSVLPPTPAETVDGLMRVQDRMQELPQVPLKTEHVIHAGMYFRTIRLAPGVVIAGALIKIPTMLVVNGSAKVFIGTGWADLEGYNVIPASAGRKQLFVARTATEITMAFPTSAKTVEEAEREFTDEAEALLSHRDENTVIITGE